MKRSEWWVKGVHNAERYFNQFASVDEAIERSRQSLVRLREIVDDLNNYHVDDVANEEYYKGCEDYLKHRLQLLGRIN